MQIILKSAGLYQLVTLIKLFLNIIYLFLAGLNLYCSMGFLQLQPVGTTLVAVRGLLFLQSMGSRACGVQQLGMWACLPRGIWNLPGPGIEPMSSALEGRFLSTVPSEKFNSIAFEKNIMTCIHLYSILQGIFTTLKIFCIPPIHLSPKHLQLLVFFTFSYFCLFQNVIQLEVYNIQPSQTGSLYLVI